VTVGLNGDDRLLQARQDLLRLSQRQPQLRDLPEATKWPDIQYTDDPCRTVDPCFNIPPQTIAVYTSWPPSPASHATLATGRLLALTPGRTCTGWIKSAYPDAPPPHSGRSPRLARPHPQC
jgi:hypothetical protein